MASKLSDSINSLSKRLRISRAQQMTMIEVAVASLIVGACAMLIIFLAKYIGLNTNVITEQGKSVDNYSTTLANIGVCVDSNNDGKISGDELTNCNPNNITLDKIPNTLQSNIMTKIAYDPALMSVPRGNLNAACLDANGKQIDFLKKYQEASSDSDKEKALELIKTCSALRVIPDALPINANTEGTLASLNYLLNQAGVRPDSMTPADTSSSSSSSSSTVNTSLDTIPISFTLSTNSQNVYRALATIERSIRSFDINSMSIEWGGNKGNLTFSFKAQAYYNGQTGIKEKTYTVTTKGGSK